MILEGPRGIGTFLKSKGIEKNGCGLGFLSWCRLVQARSHVILMVSMCKK